jgi:hypothetical protein
MSAIVQAMHYRHIERIDDVLSLKIEIYNKELHYIDCIYVRSGYGPSCDADKWAIKAYLRQFALDICNRLHIRTVELRSHAGQLYGKTMKHCHTDIALRARALLSQIKKTSQTI